jgi:hypothetical protein
MTDTLERAIRTGAIAALLEQAIQQHLPPEQFRVLKAAEKSEQELIGGLIGMATRSIPRVDGGAP